jgi:hypothetical protein
MILAEGRTYMCRNKKEEKTIQFRLNRYVHFNQQLGINEHKHRVNTYKGRPDYPKRKTSNKAEMKSILRHILTPFDKEFHRKMRICNLKTSNFSKFEKLEKNLKKCMCGIPGQK